MKDIIPNFLVWYNDYAGFYVCYNYDNETFKTVSKLPDNINSFYLPNNYKMRKKDKTKTGIKEDDYDAYLRTQCINYAESLIEWRNELLLYSKFDYFDNRVSKTSGSIYYKNHKRNINAFFGLYSNSGRSKNYSEFDDIFYDEYKWFKNCKNSGLLYLKDNKKYENLYGYDFKMSYPTDMASIKFMIPSKTGVEKTYKYLPDFLAYGIYRVKIECIDKNFNMIFETNKKHYYTHYSLRFAIELKKHFKINIELIQDGKPNAYVYNKADLVHGNKIFGKWFYTLRDLKTQLPKNGLVKMLASAGWGTFNELKTLHLAEDKVDELLKNGKRIAHCGDNMDYIIKDIKLINGEDIYELINAKEPIYNLPLRLLSFITSFSRVKMGSLINKHNLFDKVIRIQTDSIIFTEELKIKIDGFLYDEKISGCIDFKHVNDYEKIID